MTKIPALSFLERWLRHADPRTPDCLLPTVRPPTAFERAIFTKWLSCYRRQQDPGSYKSSSRTH
jgi:hypothetical protein